ncbi:hypothetical protein BDZ89DRAFT_1133641 [Hymenopellis radicata]|nr:hypothetical protein BDZ89DRAFT_1133641 [Hymenopellis radicata]
MSRLGATWRSLSMNCLSCVGISVSLTLSVGRLATNFGRNNGGLSISTPRSLSSPHLTIIASTYTLSSSLATRCRDSLAASTHTSVPPRL